MIPCTRPVYSASPASCGSKHHHLCAGTPSTWCSPPPCASSCGCSSSPHSTSSPAWTRARLGSADSVSGGQARGSSSYYYTFLLANDGGYNMQIKYPRHLNPGPAVRVGLLHVRLQARRQPARADRAAARRIRRARTHADRRHRPQSLCGGQSLPRGLLRRVSLLCVRARSNCPHACGRARWPSGLCQNV